jgi:serine protease Do
MWFFRKIVCHWATISSEAGFAGEKREAAHRFQTFFESCRHRFKGAVGMKRELSKLSGRAWLGMVGVFVALFMLTIAGGAVYQLAAKSNASHGTPWYAESSQATPSPATTASEPAVGYAKSLSKAFRDASGRVLPAVVMVINTPAVAKHPALRKQPGDDESQEMPFGFQGAPFGDLFKGNPELRRFFKEMPGLPSPESPGHGAVGAGSGVIVDPSGVVLTNNHVVAGGGQILVRLHDGREFKAFDIKTDPTSDLAVLHIKSKEPLPVAKLGDSGAVDVGDWVLALGEPFGLEGTVTAGIVSAKQRGIGINEHEDYIQTDAAINPGNSGGPLVNLEGEVIGINTAISSNSGGYQGVGFAIPINVAKWVGGELVKYGTVHRAYLGVMIQPVSQSLAEEFNVKVHQGVLITQVQAKTPAAKAGLKPGDIVTEFAGKPVSNPRELQGMVEMSKVNSSAPLTILRDGKQMTLSVICAERPATLSMARAKSEEEPGKAESSRFEKLGIQVEDLTPQVAQQLGIEAEQGVVITNVRSGGPANLAGLSTGMVIAEADRQPIKSVADFRKVLDSKPLDKGLLMLVRTAEGSRFVVIRTASE